MSYRPIKLIEVINSEAEFIYTQGIHNHLSEVKFENSEPEHVEYLPEQKKIIIKDAGIIKVIIPNQSYLEIKSDKKSKVSGKFNYGRINSNGSLDLKCEQVDNEHVAKKLLSHLFYIMLLMLVLSPVLGGIHALGYNSLHYLDWLGLITSSLYITWNGLDRVAKRLSLGLALLSVFLPELLIAFTEGDFLQILRQEEWLENLLQVLTFITLWKLGKYLKDHWFKSAM